MDTGAYASYPKRRRTFKKTLGVKRYRRYKQVNPVNQFTFKKTRVGKYTKTNQQGIKATYTSTIYLNSNGNYVLGGATNQFINLAAMLSASPEFTSRSVQYSYFMINGMAVTFTRKWIDPVTIGGSNEFIAFPAGLSMLSTNFYPNLSSSTVGQPVEDADSSWKTSPFIHGAQNHYQPFPKNFTTGTNSYGLGVWNACNGYTSISGELAFYNDVAASVNNGVIAIWDVEVNVYCMFCNNTGI